MLQFLPVRENKLQINEMFLKDSKILPWGDIFRGTNKKVTQTLNQVQSNWKFAKTYNALEWQVLLKK